MNTTIATSIQYGNYKHLQLNAQRVQSMIELHTSEILNSFEWDLDVEDIEFKIRPIKGGMPGRTHIVANYVTGIARVTTIEIDPRNESCEEIVHALVHELCIAEQYRSRILKFFKRTNQPEYADVRYKRQYKIDPGTPWEQAAEAAASEYKAA